MPAKDDVMKLLLYKEVALLWAKKELNKLVVGYKPRHNLPERHIANSKTQGK